MEEPSNLWGMVLLTTKTISPESFTSIQVLSAIVDFYTKELSSSNFDNSRKILNPTSDTGILDFLCEVQIDSL